MERFSRLKRFLYSSFLMAFAVLVGIYLHNFLSSDPLARYRLGSENPDKQEMTILLKDVEFRQYQNQHLVSTAQIKSLSISKDRKTLAFSNIEKGTYFASDNKFHFSAAEGSWSPNEQKLYATRDVRVFNQELDLHSRQFEYEEPTHTLKIPDLLRGKLFEGDVEAYRLVYQTNLNSYTVGPITWVGRPETLIEKAQQSSSQKNANAPEKISPSQPPSAQKAKGERESVRLWTIKAKSASRPPGDMEYWQYGEATDGEVVVKADHIERNVKTDVIVATGNLRYYSADVNALCDKVTVYRTGKRAVLAGNVQAFVKPKEESKLEVVELEPIRPIVPAEVAENRPPAPEKTIRNKELDDELRSSKSKRKYPTVIWADKIEYWYQKGNRHAIITGHPMARQDFPGDRWRQVWTHIAYYDREKDTLKLVSSKDKKDTRIRTSVGDDLVATWFQLSTKEEDETWEGEGIEGDVYLNEEEETSSS